MLIAAARWLTARLRLPLVLSELGASAGLNLLWDQYALQVGGQRFGPREAALTLTPEWRGPLPPPDRPLIAARAGVDLNPLDPLADRLRLLSYIWPDQPDRLERAEVALDLAARLRPPIAPGDAVAWLAGPLAPMPGRLHLIYHTVVWQYLPAESQRRGEAQLDAAGARATPEAPLARLAMEGDGLDDGAANTLQIWPKGDVLAMGRVDFHGRWLNWVAPAPEGRLSPTVGPG